MSKLLTRIFSFSKRSRPNLDPDFNPIPDAEVEGLGVCAESVLDPVGSIRTTGGIGGLGKGITNVYSQLPNKGSKGKSTMRSGILGSYTRRIGRAPRSTSGPVTNDPALVTSQDEDANLNLDAKESGGIGMRKRRLRRASLSASNLLSWGMNQNENGSNDPVKETAPSSNRTRKPKESEKPTHLRTPSGYDKETDNDPLRREKKGSELRSKNLSHHERHGENRSSVGRRGQDPEEQLTRLLRNSSTNYKVISEIDYKAFGPIEHPIHAVARRSQEFNSIAPSQNQHVETTSLSHTVSVNSIRSNATTTTTTTTSIYEAEADTFLAYNPGTIPLPRNVPSNFKVTVHRQRLHSRTSFPDANRALDHLDSISMERAEINNSEDELYNGEHNKSSEEQDSSMRFIGDLIKREERFDKDYSGTGVTSRIVSDSSKRQEPFSQKRQRTMSTPAPSKIPVAMRSLIRTRDPAGGGKAQVVVPLKTVSSSQALTSWTSTPPLGSQRSDTNQLQPLRLVKKGKRASSESSSGSTPVLEKDGDDGGAHQTIRTVPGLNGTLEVKDFNVEKGGLKTVTRYTTPLKDDRGRQLQVHDDYERSLDSPSPMPSKQRNVLKKKHRESIGSIASLKSTKSNRQSIDSDFWASKTTTATRESQEPSNSKDVKHTKSGGQGAREKPSKRVTFRNAFGVLNAVEGLVDKLQNINIDATPQKPRLIRRATTPYHKDDSDPFDNDGDQGSSDDGDEKAKARSTQQTPNDKGRLAMLRRDPSVLSLLDVYESNGTLKSDAFSNTPPTKDFKSGGVQQRQAFNGDNPKVKNVKSSDWIGSKVQPKKEEPRKALLNAPKTSHERSSPKLKKVAFAAVSEVTYDPQEVADPKGNQGSKLSSAAPRLDSEEALPPERHNDSPSLSHTSTSSYVKVSSVSQIVNPHDTRVLPKTQYSRRQTIVGKPAQIDQSSNSSGSLDTSSVVKEINSSTTAEHGSIEQEQNPPRSSSSVGQSNNQQERKSLSSESNVSKHAARNPKRASEVFAFLNSPRKRAGSDEDESFEVGALDGNIAQGHRHDSPPSQVNEADCIQALSRAASAPLLTRMITPTPSPSKRPFGPRYLTTPIADANPNGANGTSQPMTSTPIPSPRYVPLPSPSFDWHGDLDNHSDGPSPVMAQDVPSPHLTIESDSFASQNTTDRSIYKGIYSFLKGTPLLQDSERPPRTQTPPNEEIIGGMNDPEDRAGSNPFLIDLSSFHKPLPSTPGSGDESDASSSRNGGAEMVITLPALPAVSPFVAHIPANRFQSVAETSPPPSPSKRYESLGVKERVAKWEATQPLSIDRQRSLRAVKLSTTPTPNPIGQLALGDGRIFNAASGTGRLYGPRSPAPTRAISLKRANSARGAIERRGSKIASPKPFTTSLTQEYPLSEELFPPLTPQSLHPPTSKFQRTRGRQQGADPSPASSSKLGAIGRQIMANARSRSTRKPSTNKENI